MARSPRRRRRSSALAARGRAARRRAAAWTWPVRGEVDHAVSATGTTRTRPASTAGWTSRPRSARPWSPPRRGLVRFAGTAGSSGTHRRASGRRTAASTLATCTSPPCRCARGSGSRRASALGRSGTSGRPSAGAPAPSLRRSRRGQPPRLPRPARLPSRRRGRVPPLTGTGPAVRRAAVAGSAAEPHHGRARPRRGGRPGAPAVRRGLFGPGPRPRRGFTARRRSPSGAPRGAASRPRPADRPGRRSSAGAGAGAAPRRQPARQPEAAGPDLGLAGLPRPPAAAALIGMKAAATRSPGATADYRRGPPRCCGRCGPRVGRRGPRFRRTAAR